MAFIVNAVGKHRVRNFPIERKILLSFSKEHEQNGNYVVSTSSDAVVATYVVANVIVSNGLAAKVL